LDVWFALSVDVMMPASTSVAISPIAAAAILFLSTEDSCSFRYLICRLVTTLKPPQNLFRPAPWKSAKLRGFQDFLTRFDERERGCCNTCSQQQLTETPAQSATTTQNW
jgi:hypothetical protein